MAKTPKGPLGWILAILGSYWLAVGSLINLFLLTWLGTLEQVEKGIHQVQEQYFESWFVFAKISEPFGTDFSATLALPGGYVTLGLFTVNLLVGGLVRIRKSRRTVGVIIAHIGIALMMVGGLLEHSQSKYGRVILREGDVDDQFSEYAGWELAIWDADQVAGVKEYLIPEEDFDDLTGEDTRKFQRDELPFDMVLSKYFINCQPKKAVGSGIPTAPVMEDYFLEALPRQKEEAADFRGVYLAALTDGGANVEETFLWGRRPVPYVLEAGGRSWAIVLRRKTHTLPFSLRLEKFTKDDHPGMTMARSFSSDVVKVWPDGRQEKAHIRMNEPLRDAGLVVYQASYGPEPGQPGEPFSVLAVSSNPSDRMPWIAVSVIALGLAWTMLDRLSSFIKREKSRRERTIAAVRSGADGAGSKTEESAA